MTESVVQDSPLKQFLVRVVVAKQLTSIDAKASAGIRPSLQSGEDVLRWLAQEYGLWFTVLDDIEPDRQFLSLFFAGVRAGESAAPETSSSLTPALHGNVVCKNSCNKENRN
jgi:hypothetical protein